MSHECLSEKGLWVKQNYLKKLSSFYFESSFKNDLDLCCVYFNDLFINEFQKNKNGQFSSQ